MTQPEVFLVVAFDHPLNAVESVADRIATALCCQGVNAASCSLPRDTQKLATLPAEQITGVLSMGSLPLSHRIQGRWLWEHVPCPVTVYLLDAILYDLARVPVLQHFLDAARRDPRLSLASPESGYHAWLGEAVAVKWDHLPFGHFGTTRPADPLVTPQPRLCVIGTVGQELGGSPAHETLPQLLDRTGLSRLATSQALQEALLGDDADAMPTRTISDLVGWSPQQALQALPALVEVDCWVKRHRRLQAMRSLRGMPVDFFGTGWRELLGDLPDFRYVGQVRHQNIAALLRHYSALVNFDPNWSGGVHDRVYTACAMGVPVLTNENSGLVATGLPPELVITYNAQRPDLSRVVEQTRLLSTPPVPTSVRHDVMAAQSWAVRVNEWLRGWPAAAAL